MGNKVVEVNEKTANAEYDKFLKDSVEKRALDSKAIVDKEAGLAELKVRLHESKMATKVQGELRDSIDKEQAALHKECDVLLQKYKLRKEARTDEIDSLN